MNWLEMPPLSSLRAFAAFAETGKVTAAGDALNVSHAAISQQMRNLESQLNAQLLDRSGRALMLTEQGQLLADALALGFGAIEGALRDITNADADRPVHISCTPTLASAWLMPRLADFRATHPDIDLMINPTLDVVALVPGGIDVALRFGEGDWPGVVSEPLLTSPIVIVAAPSLISDRTITQPSDLTAFPWLDEFGGIRKHEVASVAWNRTADGQGPNPTARQYDAGRRARRSGGYHNGTAFCAKRHRRGPPANPVSSTGWWRLSHPDPPGGVARAGQNLCGVAETAKANRSLILSAGSCKENLKMEVLTHVKARGQPPCEKRRKP